MAVLSVRAFRTSPHAYIDFVLQRTTHTPILVQRTTVWKPVPIGKAL